MASVEESLPTEIQVQILIINAKLNSRENIQNGILNLWERLPNNETYLEVVATFLYMLDVIASLLLEDEEYSEEDKKEIVKNLINNDPVDYLSYITNTMNRAIIFSNIITTSQYEFIHRYFIEDELGIFPSSQPEWSSLRSRWSLVTEPHVVVNDGEGKKKNKNKNKKGKNINKIKTKKNLKHNKNNKKKIKHKTKKEN